VTLNFPRKEASFGHYQITVAFDRFSNLSKQLYEQGKTITRLQSHFQSVSCEVIRFLPSDTAWGLQEISLRF
jgi:hypothetical protein